MKIRKYKKEDEKKVQKMILSVLREIYHKTLPEWENFEDYSLFLVAEEKEKIIASLALKKKSKKIVKLKRMYVKTSFQRKGIGQKILEEAINFCKEKRFQKIILTTYSPMKPAIKFYQKNGFKIVKNPPDLFFTHPQLKIYNQNQIAMERNIK